MRDVKPQNGAWLLFIVLALVTGYLRYGAYLHSRYAFVPALLTPAHCSFIAKYGPYLAIAIHVTIVLHAFQDTVFQGILCVIIPFYSLFYLFLVSDNFYLRAFVAGIGVGIAQDSAIFFQDVASRTAANIDRWIASGAGTPKRLAE